MELLSKETELGLGDEGWLLGASDTYGGNSSKLSMMPMEGYTFITKTESREEHNGIGILH